MINSSVLSYNQTQHFILFFFQECTDKLNLKNLVSISMDGPSVNWKLFELFQKDQAEQYGGKEMMINLMLLKVILWVCTMNRLTLVMINNNTLINVQIECLVIIYCMKYRIISIA